MIGFVAAASPACKFGADARIFAVQALLQLAHDRSADVSNTRWALLALTGGPGEARAAARRAAWAALADLACRVPHTHADRVPALAEALLGQAGGQAERTTEQVRDSARRWKLAR
jgi:hypothetical protein